MYMYIAGKKITCDLLDKGPQTNGLHLQCHHYQSIEISILWDTL